MIEFNEVFYHYQNEEDKIHLKDINLNIPKGQFILITGKSGCGKTTISQCINGLIPYFNEGKLVGKILVDGNDTRELSIEEIGEKAGSVFQNPRSQFFTTNTFDEIAFGCQNMSLPKEEILERVDEALRCFKIEDLKERSLFDLSSGEKQKVAIASCYCMRPKIFLLDEPSANLDPKAIYELSKILASLKSRGYTIVIMEHRLYYLKDLIDRVLYMKDGEIIKEFTREEALKLSTGELEEMGLRVFDLNKIKEKAHNEDSCFENTIKLSVENLSFDYKKKKRNSRILLKTEDNKEDKKEKSLLKDINFKAQSGDIIGIVGKNGCGKTTLSKIVTGLLKNNHGVIKINDKEVNEKERLKEIYFVLQDSDYQLFTESVDEELKLGNENIENLEEKAKSILESLGLNNCLDRHPASLSRGQKQRLTIAGALLSERKILILDEPTSGLDGKSMRQVIKMMEYLKSQGKIVLVISHDYEFLIGCCTHILKVKDGISNDKFALNEESMGRLKKILFSEEEIRCGKV